jgi:acyl carrier protein
MPGVLDAVLAAVTDLNRQLPPGRRITLSRDASLTGPGGGLDSLGLINLIVGVEQHLEQDLSVRVALTDHETLSRSEQVLATIGTLTDHIEALLAGKTEGE